jgi:hypothetical protein
MHGEREKIYNISPNEFLSCVIVGVVLLLNLGFEGWDHEEET